MEHGICMLSLVPMRAETSDRAELVTQLIFGECYEVVNTDGNWLQLQLATDGYRGWIDFKQHTAVTPEYFDEWKTTSHARALDLVQLIHIKSTQIPIGVGSYLPFYDDSSIRVNEERYTYAGRASTNDEKLTQVQLAAVASNFLKFPYLWGGKSVFGIDCSGFTQQVFGICGYQLPRDAYQQVTHGQEVHFVEQTQPGDLAFFSNTEGRITHVGMMLEGQRIMHAHGEVRIDTLDHTGIYNQDLKRYTHQLRIIKRILL
ncbi:C40 family peptidase [Pontibacter pamirensis]|uniref:C40 family peptidase n=1 Tax=Pontibacter pamirensis TaxID=2562824 RepID=UPI001F481132|nr:C40 family peptidase [Pontibacter pamirensis]